MLPAGFVHFYLSAGIFSLCLFWAVPFLKCKFELECPKGCILGGVGTEVFASKLSHFNSMYIPFPLLHIPHTLSAAPSISPCRWILLPIVTCCKLFQSLRCRRLFSPQCLPVGVSLTTGIKEPLQTGWGAYLKQQACHRDYFKWELESNCCRVPAPCWLWVIMHCFSGKEQWNQKGLPCCFLTGAHRWIEEWGNWRL